MFFRHFRTSFFKLSYLYLSYVTQLYILEPGPSFMVYYNELWSQVWYGDRYRVSFGDRCLLSLCCEEPKSCKISTFSLVYHTWLVDCLVWSAIFTKWARYIITRWTIFYSLFDLSFLLTFIPCCTYLALWVFANTRRSCMQCWHRLFQKVNLDYFLKSQVQKYQINFRGKTKSDTCIFCGTFFQKVNLEYFLKSHVQKYQKNFWGKAKSDT